MGGEINEKTKVPLGWAIAIFIFLGGIVFSYGALYQKVDRVVLDVSELKTLVMQALSRDNVVFK